MENKIDIKSLIPDKRNANKGNDEGRKAVRSSLDEFGAARSVVLDKDGNIIAGNKTVEAAIAAGYQDVLVVETDGTTLVAVQRTDLDIDSDKATRLGLADNRTGEVGLSWDAVVLKQMVDEGVKIDDLFDKEALDELGVAVTPDTEAGDGSLLGLVDITIAEPRHKVEKGQIFEIGENVLLCVDLMSGWETWSPYLDRPDCLFIPYPGPFIPLSKNANGKRLVMVQPNPYIAGHILDRYEDVMGEL